MRRHRAAYRAPAWIQHHGHRDDNNIHQHELSVPLLVEVPHHYSPALVSPPSSVGSVDTSYEDDFPLPELPSPPRVVRRHRLRRRILKSLQKLYFLMLDFLLLVFVCIMGIFFDVEVQMVRQDRRRAHGGRGSGRVVIQTTTSTGDGNRHGNGRNNDRHCDYNQAYYRSSNLLHSPPVSLQGGEEEYWYHDPVIREEIV